MSSVCTSPADLLAILGGDGSIYFGCNDKKVYALAPDGTQRWAFLTKYQVSGSPAVDDTGVVFAGSWDMYLIKVNDLGDTLWTRTYGGPSYDEAWGIIPGSDGNFLVAGHTGSYGAGDADFYLVKIDPEGNPLWSRTYGGTGEDKCGGLCASGDGDYYLAGRTASFTTPAYFDAYILKIEGAGTAVLPDDPQPLPDKVELLPPFPNPFNTSTAISYELQAASLVSLQVYDTAGRLVATLVDGPQASGAHSVTFDGSNLASGIYLARLATKPSDSGNPTYTATQKLVLMK